MTYSLPFRNESALPFRAGRGLPCARIFAARSLASRNIGACPWRRTDDRFVGAGVRGRAARGRKGTRMAKTVLIVEDNELNMKLFHDLLEAHGYGTVGTRNGIEAL